MNRWNRPLIWLVAGVLAVGLLWMGYRFLNQQSGEGEHNPYEYNLDDYRAVDPELIGFSETAHIDLDQSDIYALAVGPNGNILLSADSKLLSFDRNGALVEEFALEAPAYCIAVSGGGEIYLGMSGHVEVYSPAGQRLGSWPDLGANSRLTSLALIGDNLYAADSGNRRVWRFDMDGQLLGSIEGALPDGRETGFLVPSPSFDLAAGPDGSLWIVNPGATLVQEYSPDGQLLRSWGKASMEIDGFSGCCNPIHIAIMDDGSFVTAEKGLPRVKVYSPAGKLESVVAAADQFMSTAKGSDGGALIRDLALNSADEILVLDAKAKMIRIFKKVDVNAK